jgi:hypothetical protein
MIFRGKMVPRSGLVKKVESDFKIPSKDIAKLTREV